MSKNKYSNELMNYLNLSPSMMLSEYELLNYILNKCQKIYGSNYKMPLPLYKLLFTVDDELDDMSEYINTNKGRIKRKLKNLVLKIDQTNNYLSVSNIYYYKIVTDIKIKIDI